jgi:hypothetical protein
MHAITVERFAHADESVWQLSCTQCGVVATHVETEELASFLGGLHLGGPETNEAPR